MPVDELCGECGSVTQQCWPDLSTDEAAEECKKSKSTALSVVNMTRIKQGLEPKKFPDQQIDGVLENGYEVYQDDRLLLPEQVPEELEGCSTKDFPELELIRARHIDLGKIDAYIVKDERSTLRIKRFCKVGHRQLESLLKPSQQYERNAGERVLKWSLKKHSDAQPCLWNLKAKSMSALKKKALGLKEKRDKAKADREAKKKRTADLLLGSEAMPMPAFDEDDDEADENGAVGDCFL